MAQRTEIEWVRNADGSNGQSWNFLRGCRRVSEGCGSDRGGGCYAERQAIRHSGPGGSYEGLVKSTSKGPRWTGEIRFVEEILLEPLKRKKPTTYFVNSMSDLFYEKVTDEMLDKAFAVMALTPQHTYQILTKRPERMKAYFDNQWLSRDGGSQDFFPDAVAYWFDKFGRGAYPLPRKLNWPLQNVWLGVSVEDQKTADERIPLLLQTPCALPWVSAEPLLEQIDFSEWLGDCECVECHRRFITDMDELILPEDDNAKCPDCGGEIVTWPPDKRLRWIVTGGESGPKSRRCDISNIRLIVDQCRTSNTPVFVKQLGANSDHRVNGARHAAMSAAAIECEHGYDVCPMCDGSRLDKMWDKKGGDPDEWPEDLRIREFPEVKNV